MSSQLDISHGCFYGTTAQFDHLRCIWSLHAGYGVVDNRAEGGPLMPNIDYNLYFDEDLLGDWPDGAPEDPLLILLVHEETRGRIKWQHCPYLAARLEELEFAMSKGGVTTPIWVLMTQNFSRGLKTAAHYRQDVLFCQS